MTVSNAAPAQQLAASSPHSAARSTDEVMGMGVIQSLPAFAEIETNATRIFEVITKHNHAPLVLTPASRGIDMTCFCSLFGGNIQVCCASRKCTNKADVEGSGHRCGCCSVKYLSFITCDMVPFRDVVRTDGFVPVMLSPYGQDIYCQYEYNFDSCKLEVCNYCKERVMREIHLDVPLEDGDNDGSVSYAEGGGNSKPSKNQGSNSL